MNKWAGSALFFAGLAWVWASDPVSAPVRGLRVQSMPFASSADSLVFKLDSLERVIRQRALTDKDKQQLSQCARVQRQFLVEKRKAHPEVAQVDSALREIKLRGVRPDDPTAARLMERKYSLEQSFENAWQATEEGKRCASGDRARRNAGDAALQANPQYRQLQERLKRQGLL